MKTVSISAKARSESGKGPNRRLRAQGLVPAVLYGMKADCVNLALNEHDFLKATSKLGDETAMFKIDAKEAGVDNQMTVIRELQRDPLSERIVHIDLYRIDPTKPIDVEVSVHSTGLAVGVRAGGVLEQATRSILVNCLPADVPPHIIVDVTNMEINSSIHVGDLQLAEGITVLTPETESLFSVIVPRIAEEGTEGVEGGEEAETEGEEK